MEPVPFFQTKGKQNKPPTILLMRSLIGICLLLLIASNLGLAQEAKLWLKDADTKEPLVGTVVRYTKQADNAKMRYALSTATGEVRLAVNSTITYRVQQLGYEITKGQLKPGEEKEIFLKTKPEMMDELVVTGQPSLIHRDSSLYASQFIDQEQIEAQGAVTLRDVLMTENNIRISQDAALGTSNMTMMGLGGENIQVLVDGVPLEGRTGSAVNLNEINLQNVERVEVIRGPMAVQYGMDALAGVINIITRSPKAKPTVELNSRWATIDSKIGPREGMHTYGLSGSFSPKGQLFSGRERWKTQFSINRHFFGGFRGNPSFSRAHEWYPKVQWNAQGRVDYQLGQTELSYRLNYLNQVLLNRGEPDSTLELDREKGIMVKKYTAPTQRYHTQRLLHTLKGEHRFNAFNRLKATMAYTDFFRESRSYRTQMHSLEHIFLESDRTYYNALLGRFQFIHSPPAGKLDYRIGLETNREWGGGARIEGQDLIDEAALYGTLDYDVTTAIGEWEFHPGVRLAYNSAFELPHEARLVGSIPFMPSFLMKYKPSKKLQIKGQYARGFRAPSLRELYYEFIDANHYLIGNPNLKAEYADHLSTGISFKHHIAKSEVKLTGDVFYNDVKERITLVQGERDPQDPSDDNMLTYANADRFRSKGINAGLSMRRERWSIQAGFAYTGIAQNFTPEGGQAFHYLPEYQLKASYKEKYTGLQASVFGKYTGELMQNALNEDGEVELLRSEGFSILDASLSKTFHKKLTLVTGVNNLTNTTNILNAINTGSAHSGGGQSAISFGRSYFVSLNWKIQ